jgi:hypothetical protein
MKDTWGNDACGGADGNWPPGGSSGSAGQWSAEIGAETVAAAVAAPSRPRAAPAGPGIGRPSQHPGRTGAGDVPLRLVQVYLTPGIDEFLRKARSMAIMQGLDVTASAVVRHAMEQLMAAASPAEMVELLGSPKGQSQPRRGRPRR